MNYFTLIVRPLFNLRVQRLSSVLIVFFSASAVFAADQLGAISVTATKTERPLFDTPDTVSRVGIDSMERNQVQKLSDVVKDIPGVNFGSGPRAIAEKPTIRGLGDNRILITVDGARQNFNSGHKGRVFVETELLKSVEVLRGAGSAVYGGSAMGGVIAMTTKDASDFLVPGKDFGLRLKTGFQDVNAEKLGTAIVFGKTELNGTLDYIFSGTLRSSDDVMLGEGETLENSAEDSVAWLAKSSWESNNHHRFTVSRQYTFDTGEVPAQADAQTSAAAVLTDRETEVVLDRLAYRHSDPENTWLNFDGFIYNNAQTIREKRIGTDGRLDVIEFDTYGVDLHNSLQFGNSDNAKQRISYGFEYYQDQMNSEKGGAANVAFPAATADFYGLYVQDEIDLANTVLGTWVLIPALRYDAYQSSTDREVLGASNSTKEDLLSPKLGVIYKASKAMNISFNYGQAFRSPTFQELYVSGSHFGANSFQPNPDLKPEKLTHGLELGVRVKSNDILGKGDKSQFRLSAYYNEYEDFIDTEVTTQSTTSVNVNDAKIHGLELEASYYTRSIDLEVKLAASYSIGENLTNDEPLTGVPGHSVIVNLQKFLPNYGLSFGGRASFNQHQNRVAAGQPTTPSYDVYDLYLSWLPAVGFVDDLQVTFGVDNVMDKNYTPHLNTLPAPGRNVKVSMSVQF